MLVLYLKLAKLSKLQSVNILKCTRNFGSVAF